MLSQQKVLLAPLLVALLLSSTANAQRVAAAKETEKRTTQPPVASTTTKGGHPFWDKENVLLFTGVAAGRALDFTSTQHFRERGLDEWLLTNSTVDNKPLFAGIELAGTAASIGVSLSLPPHRSPQARTLGLDRSYRGGRWRGSPQLRAEGIARVGVRSLTRPDARPHS